MIVTLATVVMSVVPKPYVNEIDQPKLCKTISFRLSLVLKLFTRLFIHFYFIFMKNAWRKDNFLHNLHFKYHFDIFKHPYSFYPIVCPIVSLRKNQLWEELIADSIRQISMEVYWCINLKYIKRFFFYYIIFHEYSIDQYRRVDVY